MQSVQRASQLAFVVASIVLANVFSHAGEIATATPIGNGDVNADGDINVTDVIYLLNWKFRQGPEPVEIARLTLAPSPADLRPERHRDASFSREFDAAGCDFTSTGRHPFFILEPGYRVTLAGVDDDGVALRVEITVLDEVEVVDGVATRVVEEREWEDGVISEISRNFVARCERTGDLFYFGEGFDDDDDDDTLIDDESPWRAGVEEAQAGVLLPGNPLVGARFFQELAPGVAMDRAEIIDIAENVTVGGRTFERVLMLYETSGVDASDGSLKYFAEGVGMVKDNELEVVAWGFVPGMAGEAIAFETLAITLEVDESDDDAKLRVSAEAPARLASLAVRAPDGELVFELRTPQRDRVAGTRGAKEIELASDEVRLAELLASYPAGVWSIEGRGELGERFAGTAILSHEVVPAPNDATTEIDPATGAAHVTWSAVSGATAYLVDISNEVLGLELQVTLPATETCFELPACLLEPGATYEVGVGSIGVDGNLAVLEGWFATADQ